MGAWIEINQGAISANIEVSHPTWVRGLKYANNGGLVTQQFVAPHMGAWIEINTFFKPVSKLSGRTPHGCVD